MTARIQSRRSVSLNRRVYNEARRMAEARGLTLAHFVETALRLAGVSAPEGEHQTREVAEKAKRARVAKGVLSGWVRR